MDYQNKIWGGSQVRLKLNYLAYNRLRHALRGFEPLSKGSRILEIGCGGGGFISSIKYYRPDVKCQGIDIGKSAIRYAKNNFSDVKFQIGNIYDLKFPNNYFDAILIEDVLEHLDNPSKALSEIYRVLRHNGIFQAYIPIEGEKYTLQNVFNKLGMKFKDEFAGHIQNYQFKDLQKMFIKNNLKITKYKYELFLIGQIVDMSFFTFLKIMNQKRKNGLENDLENKPILKLFKNIITVLVNIESMIFSDFSGAGVNITSIKR